MFFYKTGHKAVIDSTGNFLYNGICEQALHLPVKHLVSVVSFTAGTSKAARAFDNNLSSERTAVTAGSNKDISVKVRYLDQCKQPIDGHDAALGCDFSLPAFQFDAAQQQSVLANQGNGYNIGTCNCLDYRPSEADCG